MKKKNLLLYCSDSAFYNIAKQVWAYCTEHQTAYYNYSKKYTKQFIADARRRLEEASTLPNKAELQKVLDNTTRTLQSANRKCKKQCQELFVYIGKSFAKGEVAYMCREAGSNYYAMASNESWCGTGIMVCMSLEFINRYAPLLLASEMPEDFIDVLRNAKEAFDAALHQYTNAKQAFTEGCKRAIEAKHEVFVQLEEVINDGNAVFQNHPPRAKYYALQPATRLLSYFDKAPFHFIANEQGIRQPYLSARAV